MKKYVDFKAIRKNARSLRKEMTESEKLLWSYLRNRRLAGYKFLRQHPIVYKADFKGLNYFVADFYCHEKKTIVELDGPIHIESEEYDNFRDEIVSDHGMHVIRIKNDDLDDLDTVLNLIKKYLDSF